MERQMFGRVEIPSDNHHPTRDKDFFDSFFRTRQYSSLWKLNRPFEKINYHGYREVILQKLNSRFGHCPFGGGGGSKRLPGWFGALI